MFISYQKVRNTVVGGTLAVIAGIGALFGFQAASTPKVQPSVSSSPQNFDARDLSEMKNRRMASQPKQAENLSGHSGSWAPKSDSANASSSLAPKEHNRAQPNQASARRPAPEPIRSRKRIKNDDPRYATAMRLASGKADRSGKGKDVLGSSSSWKLNLYDDNKDGQYDRAKLDWNRDEVDDEKWTYKKGRWERNSGREIWTGKRWSNAASTTSKQTSDSPDLERPDLERYRLAMKIASGKADRSGKGKDVMGTASPWKLNLYDDDRDGTWDRAKLDKNRDEVDDEKWNFKKGRWEKDGGKTIWDGTQWTIGNSPTANTRKTTPDVQRYRAAFKMMKPGSKGVAKAKDFLGSNNPWKLNLYDDNQDGTWDRAKLDKNRDNVDDEKWNFKHGRWEKDGGDSIWDGQDWVRAK